MQDGHRHSNRHVYGTPLAALFGHVCRHDWRESPAIETHTGLYKDLGLERSRMWPAGTLCITIAANIAVSGILGFDACFPDSVVGFIPASPIPSVRYFEYFMRTAKGRLKQFVLATAQKNIDLGILEQFWIPLPPVAEQIRIIAKVEGNFFVAVKFTRLVERTEHLFPIHRVKLLDPTQQWTPQASGIEIPAVTARKLEAAWEKFWGSAEERRLQLAVKYMEGALERAEVNRYERKAGAKLDCIRAHGWDCVVCGINFEARYGNIGREFIHVHHLEELSQRGKSKATDPAHDLRPVCPNCHAMLHRESPALTIEELKRRLRD